MGSNLCINRKVYKSKMTFVNLKKMKLEERKTVTIEIKAIPRE